MINDDTTTELLDRTRRIETRLTQTMLALGVPVNARKAVFQDGTVRLTSRNTALAEITSIIPSGWTDSVQLVIGCDVLGTLTLA